MPGACPGKARRQRVETEARAGSAERTRRVVLSVLRRRGFSSTPAKEAGGSARAAGNCRERPLAAPLSGPVFHALSWSQRIVPVRKVGTPPVEGLNGWLRADRGSGNEQASTARVEGSEADSLPAHPVPRRVTRLDGRPSRLRRSDLSRQAMAIDPGRHRIELTDDAPAVRHGQASSLAGLSFLAVAEAVRPRARQP